jgi:hypothetical protein
MQNRDPPLAGDAAAIVPLITAWLRARPDVRAVALVGSVARGTARPDSDIDFVVLVDDPQAYRQDTGWVQQIPWGAIGHAVHTHADQDYGIVWSRHITLAAGPEVEMGFSTPAWAINAPSDPGTYAVVTNGCLALYDPAGLLARMLAAIEAGRARS